jgi:hypothetical protein
MLPLTLVFVNFTSLFAPCIFIELLSRKLPTIMHHLIVKVSYKIISVPTCFGGGYYHRRGEFLHWNLKHRWYKTKSVLLCTRCKVRLSLLIHTKHGRHFVYCALCGKLTKFDICKDLWSKCAPFALIGYIKCVCTTKNRGVIRTLWCQEPQCVNVTVPTQGRRWAVYNVL